MPNWIIQFVIATILVAAIVVAADFAGVTSAFAGCGTNGC